MQHSTRELALFVVLAALCAVAVVQYLRPPLPAIDCSPMIALQEKFDAQSAELAQVRAQLEALHVLCDETRHAHETDDGGDTDEQEEDTTDSSVSDDERRAVEAPKFSLKVVKRTAELDATLPEDALADALREVRCDLECKNVRALT